MIQSDTERERDRHTGRGEREGDRQRGGIQTDIQRERDETERTD